MYSDYLSAQANLPSYPDNDQLEGYVVPGSWNPAEGTYEVLIGNTAALFTDFGDAPTTIVVNAYTHALGAQYGPVGLERVSMFRTDSGYSATLEHGPDDTPGAPAGEHWTLHRNAATGVYDSGWRLTNDGPTPGDGLGGAHVGGTGAITTLTTASGHTVTLNDLTKTITVSATGPAGTSQTVMNATTGSISHVVPTGAHIGLGVLAEDIALSCAGNAILNVDHLAAYESGRLAAALLDFIKNATLYNTIGLMTSGQLIAALAALVGNWIHGITLPIPTCCTLTPT